MESLGLQVHSLHATSAVTTRMGWQHHEMWKRTGLQSTELNHLQHRDLFHAPFLLPLCFCITIWQDCSEASLSLQVQCGNQRWNRISEVPWHTCQRKEELQIKASVSNALVPSSSPARSSGWEEQRAAVPVHSRRSDIPQASEVCPHAPQAQRSTGNASQEHTSALAGKTLFYVLFLCILRDTEMESSFYGAPHKRRERPFLFSFLLL